MEKYLIFNVPVITIVCAMRAIRNNKSKASSALRKNNRHGESQKDRMREKKETEKMNRIRK